MERYFEKLMLDLNELTRGHNSNLASKLYIIMCVQDL